MSKPQFITLDPADCAPNPHQYRAIGDVSELAASIRADAARLQEPLPQLERLMESLVYEAPKAIVRQVDQQAEQYLASLRQLSSEQLAGRKDQVKQLYHDFDYLVRFKILPANEKPKLELHKLIHEQHWDKK